MRPLIRRFLAIIRWTLSGARRTFLQRALAFYIGFLLVNQDPFGLSEAASTASSAALNAILGSFYDHSRQNEIVVTLFDDEYVKHTGNTWPASYAFHAKALQAIKTLRPRAVFLDIIFLHEREDPTLKRLLDAIEGLRPIPVFLAVSGPSVWNEDGEGLRKEFIERFRQSDHVKLVRVARHVNPFEADKYSFLIDERDETPYTANRRYASAAWALYQELCLTPSPGNAAWAPPRCEEPPIQTRRDYADGLLLPSRLDADEPFRIIWARGKTSRTKETFAECAKSHGPFATIWHGLTEGFRSGLDTCPYADTVYLADLVEAARAKAAGRALPFDLSDKVVMYGASLSLSHDIITPPTHQGFLPGIYLHAMALNNLLTHGDAFKSDRANLGSFKVSLYAVNLFGYVLIYAFFAGMRRVEDRIERRRGTLVGFLMMVGRLIAQLGVIVAYGGICYFFLDLAPINWLWIYFVGGIVPPAIETVIEMLLSRSAAIVKVPDRAEGR